MNFWQDYRRITFLCIVLQCSIQLVAFHTTVLNSKNGIAGNAVHSVFVDHTNRVWLGTDNGVSCITSNGVTNYIFSNGLTESKVWEIAQSDDKRLWFGSFGNGLYEFKNNRFGHFPLPRSRANNSIRRIFPYENLLFIGTEAGLNVFDLQTNRFLTYKNLTPVLSQVPVHDPDSFQILGFFEFNQKVCFQTFFKGTYEIDSHNKTYRRVRFNSHENVWNYSAVTYQNKLILARTKFDKSQKHNLLYWDLKKYMNGGKPDSIEFNSVVWNYEAFSNYLLFASWGVRDDSGGLYKLIGNKVHRLNEELGVNSNQLVDLVYAEKQNKLYVASVDKGVYRIDFNRIIKPVNGLFGFEVLDMQVIGGKLVVLQNDTVLLYTKGKIVKSITLMQIQSWMQRKVPNFRSDVLRLKSTERFKSLSCSDTHIVINSNFAAIRLDLNLNLVDYITTGSDGSIHFISNRDVLFFRDYASAELFMEFGKGKHRVFNYWDSLQSNPRVVDAACWLNDSLVFITTANRTLYLFNSNQLKYRKTDKSPLLQLPLLMDEDGENSIVVLDKSNKIYKLNYQKDSLYVNEWMDLSKKGVFESFFVKSFGKLLVAGTNRGILIVDNNTVYQLDAEMGINAELVTKTASLIDDTLMVATSGGVLKVDMERLKKMNPDYTLSNLVLVADSFRYPIEPGSRVKLKEKFAQLTVMWEINSHPYPGKLNYSYRFNKNSAWNKVDLKGQLRILNPPYGLVPVYLRINDDTNGEEKIVMLMVLNSIKPFYAQNWFFVLSGMLCVGVGYFFYSRKRFLKLRQKTDNALKEAHELQLRLDILQLLLKPHFIFNALSSVQNLIFKNDIDKTLEYIGYFSKYLRAIMQNSGSKLVPLQEEFDNCLRYTELEKLRFNEKVDLQFKVDSGINSSEILIIPFLFQPFIENIFKHAFDKDSLQPLIRIEVRMNDNELIYTIADNGKGTGGKTLEDIISQTGSKGLKIITAQLEKFFAGRSKLRLVKGVSQGTEWEIRVPAEY